MRHPRFATALLCSVSLAAPQAPVGLTDAVAAARAAAAAGDPAAARAQLDAAAQVVAATAPGACSAADLTALLGAAELARATAHTGQDLALARRLVAELASRPAADRERLHARSLLALALVDRGEIDEGLALQREVEATLAAAATANDPRLPLARARLARTLRRARQIEAAVRLGSEAEAALAAIVKPDDVDLQVARHYLAMTRKAVGDRQGALALFVAAEAALAGKLPAHALERIAVRFDLATMWIEDDDRQGVELLRTTLDACAATFPADHPLLAQMRANLAGELIARDPVRARELAELAVAALAPHRDDSHAALAARLTAAQCRRATGDLAGAATLLDAVERGTSVRLADDPMRVVAVLERAQLARAAGDPFGAHAALQELAARLPAEHVRRAVVLANLVVAKADCGLWQEARALGERLLGQLASARPRSLWVPTAQNVAIAHRQLGDPGRARKLQDEVLALLADEPDGGGAMAQLVGMQLAVSLAELGDLGGARRRMETVFAGRPLAAGDDFEANQNNLAALCARSGDLDTAETLQRRVLAARRQRLPPADLRLQHARTNLAATLLARGDATAARALQQEALAALAEHCPGSADLALARAGHAAILLHLGDAEGAAAAADEALRAFGDAGADERPEAAFCLATAARAHAARGDGAGASRLARRWIVHLRAATQRLPFAPREAALWSANHAAVLDVAAALVLGRPPLAADPELAADLLLIAETLRGADARAARLAAVAASRGAADEASALARARTGHAARLAARSRAAHDAGALRELAEARDAVQRRLAELGHRLSGFDPAAVTVPRLGRALPPRTAAAALRCVAPPDERWLTGADERVVALVLRGDGRVTAADLGPRQRLAELAAGLAARGQYAPGRTALRELVIDPIRGLLPAGTERLLLTADEVLQCVPWDALESADGSLVGDHLAIHGLDSLFELLAEAAPKAAPAFVGFGDADHGRAADANAAGDRSGARFAPLPHSRAEVEAIAALFAARAAPTTVHLAGAATRANLLAVPAQVTHLHVAAHGSYRFEAVDGARLRRAADLPAFRLEQELPVSALAPMALCSVALAGANRAAGDGAGLVTAEELAALDLSRCELVVLSACDGATGLVERGRGVASLRAGFRAAGARCVVASLWPVDDAATKALMTDFYARLLADPGHDVAGALWAARLAAARRGASFRDWAGWAVVGR